MLITFEENWPFHSFSSTGLFSLIMLLRKRVVLTTKHFGALLLTLVALIIIILLFESSRIKHGFPSLIRRYSNEVYRNIHERRMWLFCSVCLRENTPRLPQFQTIVVRETFCMGAITFIRFQRNDLVYSSVQNTSPAQ
jgi:hypothetical protein